MKTTYVSLIVALCFGSAGVAQAYDIYNNIGAATVGTDPVSTYGPLADSFTTLGEAVPVADLQFLLEGTPGSGGFFQISLLADNGGTPGSVIASSGAIPDSLLNTTLTPLGATCNCNLTADTRYWLQIADDGGTSALWAWSNDLTGPGVAGEYFANKAGIFPNTDGPYQMKVSVAGVPEPATWTLMLAGTAGLGATLRRRRRAAVA